MIKAVLFDVWGTLYETTATPSPFREVNALLEKSFSDYAYLYAFETCTALDTSGDVSIIASRLLDRIALQVNRDVREQLERALIRAFTGHIRAYDDTEPVLRALQGRYSLGLLSNCGLLSADNLRKRATRLSQFDAAVFSYEEQLLKPAPEIFHRLLNKIGAKKPEDALYIGDHWQSDYLGALEAGLCAVLLDRKGRHIGKDICLIRSLEELPGILASNVYARPSKFNTHAAILKGNSQC